MSLVYADNNATTQVAPEVYEAMIPFLTGDYFNPSSMYEPARRTAQVVAQSRAAVAGFFGVDPHEVLFTSCATESNNAALQGTAQANPRRRHIITTAVEHPAELEVSKEMARSCYEVTYLAVDRSGNLDVRELIRALRPDTLLVSIMHANNETGVVFPVEQLSRVVKETDPAIVFHTDGSTASQTTASARNESSLNTTFTVVGSVGTWPVRVAIPACGVTRTGVASTTGRSSVTAWKTLSEGSALPS